MKTNKLYMILLGSMLLSAQCQATTFDTESLRASKIERVTLATYDSNGQHVDITQEVAIVCSNKYLCRINLRKLLESNGRQFTTPYDFKIDYDTTRHKSKHKEKLNKSGSSVTVKGFASHLGTASRNVVVGGIVGLTIAGLVIPLIVVCV